MAAATWLRGTLRGKLRGKTVVLAAPGDSFAPAVLRLRIVVPTWKVSWAEFQVPSAPASGGMVLKYWNGSAWAPGTLKYWNGSAWVAKPLKRWSGASWVTA